MYVYIVQPLFRKVNYTIWLQILQFGYFFGIFQKNREESVENKHLVSYKMRKKKEAPRKMLLFAQILCLLCLLLISAFQEAIFGCRIVFIRRSCDKIKAVFFCKPLRKTQSESSRAASLKLFFYKKHGYVCFPFAHLPHLLATHCFLRLSRVCGRSSKEERLPLFVLFVLFGQAKSTLCFMYFCMTKSTNNTKHLF